MTQSNLAAGLVKLLRRPDVKGLEKVSPEDGDGGQVRGAAGQQDPGPGGGGYVDKLRESAEPALPRRVCEILVRMDRQGGTSAPTVPGRDSAAPSDL